MGNIEFARDIYSKATLKELGSNANGTREDIINTAIIMAYNQAIEDATREVSKDDGELYGDDNYSDKYNRLILKLKK